MDEILYNLLTLMYRFDGWGMLENSEKECDFVSSIYYMLDEKKSDKIISWLDCVIATSKDAEIIADACILKVTVDLFYSVYAERVS